MTPVRLEPATSRSRVKHSTTEPLHSLLLYETNYIDRKAGTLANSDDPDELPHSAAIHQGLHCLKDDIFKMTEKCIIV